MKMKKRLLAMLMVLIMTSIAVLSCVSLIANAAESSEIKGNTVCDVLGMDPDIYMNWLLQHETDDYYLGTPYRGYDYRNPNGDCNGAYGEYDIKGQAGMNCTGFVWHVLYKATKNSGGNTSIIPALGRYVWLDFYQSNNISRRYFNSKEEMLNSGYLSKGDIIWCLVDGEEYIPNDDHHVGIYWGDGHSDVLWHSSGNTGTNFLGNVITKIIPKYDDDIMYMVLKVGASQLGTLKLVKESADTSITNNNTNYSFAGIRYEFFTDKADAQKSTYYDITTTPSYIGMLELDASGIVWNYNKGSRQTLRNLKAGTYYVREMFPSAIRDTVAYELDPTVYTIKISVNHSRKNPYILKIKETPKHGYVKVIKSSADPEVTDNNSDYTFEGIKYAFYEKQSEAASDNFYNVNVNTSYVGSIVLNADGTGSSNENGTTAAIKKLPFGTYYVREHIPSAIRESIKYDIDDTVYKIIVNTESTVEQPVTLSVTDIPDVPDKGYCRVVKRSSNNEITANNNCYSLKGALFGMYSSEDDAVNNENIILRMTTDQNGVANSPELEIGRYWLKELSAPIGYELTEEVKSVEIKANKTATVTFKDPPKLFKPEVLLEKQCSSEGYDSDYSLKGAEYTFKYYSSYYNDEELAESRTPAKVWVFATDDDGVCSFSESNLVKGDSLYKDENNSPAIPLGTLIIQETKAPEKFLLDDTVFLRNITLQSVDDISQYIIPVSKENPIPELEIRVNKIWDDNDDSEGIRPDSVSVDLFRDEKIVDTVELNEDNNWSFSFSNLPEGIADIHAEDGYHHYDYDLQETAIDGYEAVTTGLVKTNNDYVFTCTFTNTHLQKSTQVFVRKAWKDFDNLFGLRPDSIIVDLYRDGEKIDSVTVKAVDSWRASFDNLPVYHEHGKKYTYTIKEQPVPGYSKPQIVGNFIVNPIDTGSVTVVKKDSNGNPMEGVKFRLYSKNTSNSDGLFSSFADGEYHFENIEDYGNTVNIYETNTEGVVKINNLPVGEYELKEISTKDGYIIYDKPIQFTLKSGSNDTLNVTVNIDNAKTVMPETGGSGSRYVYIISVICTGLSIAILFTCYLHYKKRKDF